MTWYCWATLAIAAIPAIRHLMPQGTEKGQSAEPGESVADRAQPFAHSGINDWMYRQRLM
jgi:hypothetical protein